ncbi:SGNH/GDSL hydrolase family protein [Streptantibioticus parmotrematis]|uniref:SGNH/GDSL hydrolase family protein n=1 Tax=Streptantibioticus parmotrematis TaxID=2873249 RepID=UPI00340E983C
MRRPLSRCLPLSPAAPRAHSLSAPRAHSPSAARMHSGSPASSSPSTGSSTATSTGSSTSTARRVACCGVAVCAVGLAWAAGAPPASATTASATTPGPRYVALGDSYSSGAKLPTQVDTNCARSDHNYPSLVARAVHAASFTDVTCAGADTTDMAGRQGSAPPQLDALRPDTTLVTVGIGGNDLDLPALFGRCFVLGLALPNGAPCKASYTPLGYDEIAAKINGVGPKIDAVLKEIHARSPRARVLLVGYPDILPGDGTTCHDEVPLASGDVPWVDQEERYLDTMLAEQAATYGARYVDTYRASVGHDVCKPVGVRWIEPKDTATTAGLHPNLAGHRAMAKAVEATLRR